VFRASADLLVLIYFDLQILCSNKSDCVQSISRPPGPPSTLTSRFYVLINLENQPTSWSSFYFDLQILCSNKSDCVQSISRPPGPQSTLTSRFYVLINLTVFRASADLLVLIYFDLQILCFNKSDCVQSISRPPGPPSTLTSSFMF
jgi:hypothetical protein